MDLDEVLSFTPTRPTLAPSRDYGKFLTEEPSKKRSRYEDSETSQSVEVGKSTAELISEKVEEAEEVKTDSNSIKRLILQFEKRVLKNQEMRVKFADEPVKFLQSEVELHEAIQELHMVATTPEHYPLLVELRSADTMLQLLAHDNTDVSVAVVELLEELSGADTLAEEPERTEGFVAALERGQLVSRLVQNMERLDEANQEEANGVHSSMGILENLVECRPELANQMATQGLMTWLLKRLQRRAFDANKLYASELLGILLQHDDDNRVLLGASDGIDILLQQLAVYKRNDPGTSEELEHMENLFNALCSSLLHRTNKEKFLIGEGLQLMNLMLRERKQSRYSALKALDYALAGEDNVASSQKFVDILGLRTIFPVFMKTPRPSRRVASGGASYARDQIEEHVCSVMASLLKNCVGTHKQRVLNKFTENDFAKVDRLVEQHLVYLERVRNADRQLEADRKAGRLKTDDGGADEETTLYMRRLDAGLFTLQLLDTILMDVCVNSEYSLRQRASQILNLRGASVKTIRSIVREYAGNIGENSEGAELDKRAGKEQQRLLNLLEKFTLSDTNPRSGTSRKDG